MEVQSSGNCPGSMIAYPPRRGGANWRRGRDGRRTTRWARGSGEHEAVEGRQDCRGVWHGRFACGPDQVPHDRRAGASAPSARIGSSEHAPSSCDECDSAAASTLTEHGDCSRRLLACSSDRTVLARSRKNDAPVGLYCESQSSLTHRARPLGWMSETRICTRRADRRVTGAGPCAERDPTARTVGRFPT